MNDKSFKEMAFSQYTQNAYNTIVAGGMSKGELVAALIFAKHPGVKPEIALERARDFWRAVDNATELPKSQETSKA